MTAQHARHAIVPDVHGTDLIAAAPALAGIEMSLVGELGRERFLTEALEPLIGDYDDIVIDTPPNSEDEIRRLPWGLTYPQTDPSVSFLGPVGFGVAAVDRPYGAVGSGGVTS